MFVFKQLVEKYGKNSKELYVALLDMEKVYNKVCRLPGLLNVLCAESMK